MMGNFYELFPLKQEKIDPENEINEGADYIIRNSLHGFNQKYYFQLRNG